MSKVREYLRALYLFAHLWLSRPLNLAALGHARHKKLMGVWHIIENSQAVRISRRVRKKIAQKYIFHLQNWFCLPRSHWFNYPFSGLCLFMRLPCSSYLWVKTRCFLQICGSLSWCHRNVRWLPDRNSTKEGTYVQWIHYHLVNSIKWPTRVQ